MDEYSTERLEAIFWRRHSNPKSGWSRVPTGPLLVYAIYRRNWRLSFALLVWAALNPVLFSPPATEDAWMTRVVLAERWWVREEANGTIGLTCPNIYNTVGGLAFAYSLYAAWRKRPVGATFGAIVASGLKLWWVNVLVRRYDASATERTSPRLPG
ncbi:MAG: DUF6653 family protein [archaeon]